MVAVTVLASPVRDLDCAIAVRAMNTRTKAAMIVPINRLMSPPRCPRKCWPCGRRTVTRAGGTCGMGEMIAGLRVASVRQSAPASWLQTVCRNVLREYDEID